MGMPPGRGSMRKPDTAMSAANNAEKTERFRITAVFCTLLSIFLILLISIRFGHQGLRWPNVAQIGNTSNSQYLPIKCQKVRKYRQNSSNLSFFEGNFC